MNAGHSTESAGQGRTGEAQFRIGACYKQRDGAVVRLTAYPSWSDAAVATWISGPAGNAGGKRYLSDGRYAPNKDDPNEPSHLLPGEVDEAGNPIKEAFKPFRVRAKPIHKEDVIYEVVAYDPERGYKFEWLYGGERETTWVLERNFNKVYDRLPDTPAPAEPPVEFPCAKCRKPDLCERRGCIDRAQSEPARPPLDWAASKPFDPFPGFVVKYEKVPRDGIVFRGSPHPVSLDSPESLRVKKEA